MLTLIIYDNEGYILSQLSGEPAPREPIGVPFMWVEVPQNQRVVKVNTSITPHIAVMEIAPPTEIELLKNQFQQDLEKEKASRLELEGAVMELTTILAMQGGI